MTPPPDKIRPWVTMTCGGIDCEFTTRAEWDGLRHEDETGHTMNWPAPAKLSDGFPGGFPTDRLVEAYYRKGPPRV